MYCLTRSLLLCPLLLLSEATAQFTINFSFSDTLSPDQQAAFDNAATTWESLITGYEDGISIKALDIAVSSIGGDSGPTKAAVQGGFIVPDEGRILFDPVALGSLSPASLETLLTREVAFVLGFGTLWTLNDLYDPDSGEYTGAAGLAAYQDEFDPSATFIPVELYAGENDVHWDEIDLAAGLTGITNSKGQDFGNELMTAWTGPDPSTTFISETTIRSLKDLGYKVVDPSPIPEPSAALLITLATGLLLQRRRATSGSA